MQEIHPTAIVSPDAVVGDGVVIGPYCVVGPEVVLGQHVRLEPHVHVVGKTRLSDHVHVYSFAVLGSPPQDLKYRGEDSFIEIGAHTVIREYVMINGGTAGGGGRTVIGQHCYLLAHTHVGHDSFIGDHCVLSHAVVLGGHTNVGHHAVIGGCTAIHQFTHIGAYAFLGGFSAVACDTPPYGWSAGGEFNFHLAGINLVGLTRNGFSKADMREIQKVYRILFGVGRPDSGDGGQDDLSALPFKQRLERVKTSWGPDHPLIGLILAFCEDKRRTRSLTVSKEVIRRRDQRRFGGISGDLAEPSEEPS